jgi:uncharacterized membrane protein (UPF0182 family)
LENSLIYVEPLYLQAESGQIPELKRVILASGERVVMAETLTDGLVQLFGASAAEAISGASTASASQDVTEDSPVVIGEFPSDVARQVYNLARQADEHYVAAQEALRAGDWTTYGTELDAMEQVLKQLVELTGPLTE